MAGRKRGAGFQPGNTAGRQWKKGESGNPGGKPRTAAEVVLFARERSIPALEHIETIMRDKKAPPGVRLAAAEALLDRAWGRPQQAIAISDDLSQLSDAELIAIEKAAIAEAEAALKKAQKTPPA